MEKNENLELIYFKKIKNYGEWSKTLSTKAKSKAGNAFTPLRAAPSKYLMIFLKSWAGGAMIGSPAMRCKLPVRTGRLSTTIRFI